VPFAATDGDFVGGFYAQWEWKVTRLEYVSVPFLQRMLREEVPAGVTEFSCHPGYVTPDYHGVYSHEREAEIVTLTDPDVRRVIHDEGIVLSSYGDLGRRLAAWRPADAAQVCSWPQVAPVFTLLALRSPARLRIAPGGEASGTLRPSDQSPNATRVVLDMEGRWRPPRMRPRPRGQVRPRFHIDLQGAELGPEVARVFPVGDAFVTAVGITSQPGPRTRIALDLARGDRTVVVRTAPSAVILEVVPEWASEETRPAPQARALTHPPPGFMPDPAPQLKAVEASQALPAPLAAQLRSAGVPRVSRPPRIEDFLGAGEPQLGMAVRDCQPRRGPPSAARPSPISPMTTRTSTVCSCTGRIGRSAPIWASETPSKQRPGRTLSGRSTTSVVPACSPSIRRHQRTSCS
jgi:hypothetical protein